MSTTDKKIDHAKLEHLGYHESGHTGFAPLRHTHTVSDVIGIDFVGGGSSSSGGSTGEHTHEITDVTGLQEALDGKADVSHEHVVADVTGLQTTLDGKANVIHEHIIGDITNLEDTLSGKADASHGHEMSDVTGLETALSGKADASHGHEMSDVTGLETALSGKADASHGHEMSEVTGLETALSGKADASHNHAISDVTNLQNTLDNLVPTSRTISVSSPLTGGGALSSDVVIGMVAASSGVDGYLSGDDWSTFNAKADASHNHEISDVTGLQDALDEKGTVGKVKLTGNKTYYVRTDGSNSNSGEENTSGGAWATVGYACQWVAANVNLNGYTVTIQIADGTYSGTINIYSDPIGPGWVIVQGNPSNYDAVVLDTTGTVQNTLYVKGAAKFIFRYLKIQCTASGGDRIGIYVDSLAYLRVTEVNMGSVVSAHFCASEGGQLLLYGNIGIGSGAGILFYTKYAGRIICSGAAFTLSGTPNFSTATAYAIGMSLQLYYGTTFTGSATGKRYDGRTLSLIDTNGGGASYFPGNAAGTVVTGAVYN